MIIRCVHPICRVADASPQPFSLHSRRSGLNPLCSTLGPRLDFLFGLSFSFFLLTRHLWAALVLVRPDFPVYKICI